MSAYYPDEVLADAPKVYLRMDTTADASGNAHPFTIVGSVPVGERLLLTDSSCSRSFNNNVANYLTVTDHADLDLGDGPFTIEVLFRMAALPGANDEQILNKGHFGYEIVVDPTTNQLRGSKTDEGSWVASTIALAAGTRYHAFIQKNGATSAIWIDGVDRTGTQTTRTLVDTANDLVIGRYQGNGGALFPWNGLIDELAIYKSILSSTRIQAHVDAASKFTPVGGRIGLFDPELDPRAWF